MPDVVVAVWVVALGVGTVAPVTRTLGIWGVASLAPIAGTIMYTGAGLVLVVFESFSAGRSFVLASVVLLLANGFGIATKRLSIDWRVVLIAGGSISAVAALVAWVPWTSSLARFTTDSFQYLVSAGFLERTGTIEGIEPIFVMKRLFVVPAIHASAVSTGAGFAAFWSPVVAIGVLSTTAWLVRQMFMRIELSWRWGLLILSAGAAFALSTNQVMFHVFYVNGHMLFAAFALVGVGLAWMVAQTGEWSLAYLSAMSFAALIPLRAEGVIAGAILLIPVLAIQGMPQAVRWLYVGSFAAVTALWYGTVLSADLGLAEFGLAAPAYLNLALAGALIVLVALVHLKVLRRYLDALPWLMVGALVVFIGVATARDPDLVVSTVSAMLSNVLFTGRWGSFWIVTVLLAFVAVGAVRVPEQRVVIPGLIGFSLGLVVFSILRGSPYRWGFGDSGNRMLMHVVPLVLLYLMAAAGVAARRMTAGT